MTRIQCKDIATIEVLNAVLKYQAGVDDRFPHIQLSDRYPAKVAYAKMEKLFKRGLIEYGVSLRTAWLTPKGKSYIDSLEQQK